MRSCRGIRSDSENVFRCVKPAINNQGVQMQFSAPGAHEKRVEVQIRYIRNRFEVIKASLGFNLPTSLYPFLLSHLASTFNLFPNANSPTRPPYTVVTGKKVSDDMRYGFGSVVVVNNTETSSPSHSSSPHMERGARCCCGRWERLCCEWGPESIYPLSLPSASWWCDGMPSLDHFLLTLLPS
jgi:hypothetical protein